MSDRFDHLVRLMARLRAPDGCPWDRKQTHESLKPYLIEEAYEVLESIDQGDTEGLREELGDVLLQVLFHAQIGAEAGRFTIDEVVQGLGEKLVRRHPHVFGTPEDKSLAANAEDVLTRWEEIKRSERKQRGQQGSVLNGVPKALPALLHAFQTQARASHVGFDWHHTTRGIEQVFAKIEEEIGELREAMPSTLPPAEDSAPADATLAAQEQHERVEAELGDVLFTLVNLARFLRVNPEEALRKATNRFTDRFHYIEAKAARSDLALAEMTLDQMDALWAEAKQAEGPSGG